MILAVSPINQTFTGAKGSMVKSTSSAAKNLQKEVKDLSQHLEKICSLKSELEARMKSKSVLVGQAREQKDVLQLAEEIAALKEQVNKLDMESNYYINSINRVRQELTKYGI